MISRIGLCPRRRVGSAKRPFQHVEQCVLQIRRVICHLLTPGLVEFALQPRRQCVPHGLEDGQRVVAFEDHDSLVTGHPVGDAGREARLALAADAVDQDPGALAVAKRAQDALSLAAPADKLGRRGDRHPALLDVEKFLVARIPAEHAARPPRGAERAAAERAGIGPGQMPMPPAARFGEMGAQQSSAASRRGISDRAASRQLLIKHLGKADRIGVIDRPVPADRVLRRPSGPRTERTRLRPYRARRCGRPTEKPIPAFFPPRQTRRKARRC